MAICPLTVSLLTLFLKLTSEEDVKMCRNVSCSCEVVVRWEMLKVIPVSAVWLCQLSIYSLSSSVLRHFILQPGSQTARKPFALRRKIRNANVEFDFNEIKQCMLICVCVGCWVLFRKKEELSLTDIKPHCDANWCAVWPFRIVCQQSTCLWPLRFTLQQDSSFLTSAIMGIVTAISQSDPRPEDKSR